MNRKRIRGLVLGIATATGLSACQTAHPPPTAPTAKTGADGRPGIDCGGPSAALPLGKATAGGMIVLARVGARRVAYVADEDAKAILTYDLDTQRALAETRLGGTPGQMWIGKDGRVLATVRDRGELVALGATAADAPLTRLCGVTTPTEPIGIAAAPDDATIVVTAGWGRALMAFDARTLAKRFDVALPREPRSVVVSDDGRTAFVSHAVGSVMSTVDLASPEHARAAIAMNGFDPDVLRDLEARKRESVVDQNLDPAFARQLEKLERGQPTCQGFALAKSAGLPGRIFAPDVIVDPGDPEEQPDGYGDDRRATEVAAVAVVDERTRKPLLSSVTTSAINQEAQTNRGRDVRPECLLPRAAVVDADTRSLLVACHGIDAVVVYDAAAANPAVAERRRWTVGAGPSGIAIDPESRRAVVWSQFDRSITTFPLLGDELVDDKVARRDAIKKSLPPLREKVPAEYALGRVLFHASGDPRIAEDGRACASCHPDGRDDALTWATPVGPRRSIMLAGRAAASAPYSWSGDETTLHDHLGNTFDRLNGRGLRNLELDALVAYVSSMPAPPPERAADPKTVERGRAIFGSTEAGCAGCHAGPSFRDGRSHDVGSRHKADQGPAFDTPSLHLVGGTGPYFHDGRYETLADLLLKSDGKMGHTSHLSAADLAALESYVRSL